MNVKFSKKKLAYVPWVALIAWVFIFVGIIVWATGMNTALSNTTAALDDLSVQSGGYTNTIHSVAVGAVVVCAIMATVMVLMSGGRTCMEKAVDEKGKAVCGSWLWLATEAVLSTIWWLILFWLVFVIFGSCLWYGAAYMVRGVLTVSLDQAQKYQNSTGGLMPPSPPSPTLPPAAPGSSSSLASVPPPPAPFMCPSGCLNLGIFDFLVQQDICVCSVSTIKIALDHTSKAYDALGSVVAGAFLLWVGASFLLMNAVADFAKTKRERELLLRAQRAAADQVGAQLALGTVNAAYAQDTLPLLQKQQLQAQQVALHQQQMQLQMQMMAQAQAANVGRTAAAPGSAPISGNSSTVNMGAQV